MTSKLFSITMLLRRLFGSLSNTNFLKGTLIWRSLAISDDVVSSTDDEDFFGITANDFYKSKIFQSSSPSNNDFSKETILTKHISNDVRKNDLEKYICTKFGKIRFDWQNIPSKGREISSHKIKKSDRSDGNIDYFERNAIELSTGSITVDNAADTVEIRNNDSEVNAEDINLIEQYFCNYKENVNNDTQKLKQKLQKNPNFFDPDSVDLEHDYFKHFDSKKKSEIDLTNDNFIESQYFHNLENNSQVKSEPNASKNSHKKSKLNLTNAAENINFTESYFPTNSFVNDNNRFPNTESSQSKEKEIVSKYNFTQKNFNPQSAFEASQKIRGEMKRKNEGPLVDSKGFRILKDQVNDLSNLTTYEIANHLKSKILYNKNDLIVINKPYGLSSHGGPGINVSMGQAVSELAKKINHPGEIHLVHRLDKETTGVIVLAKTDKMAHTLKDMFQKRQVIKTYWTLTKGIPNLPQGIIDIPIAEGSVDGKHRMVLKPEYNEERYAMKKTNIKSHQAITHYQVHSSSCNCALVECKTETGIKHQVRVHLAFGLNTPILGDHKYSHLTKMAPQRLFPEILERLHIRQSKVRHVPMHLHAMSVILPEVINGQNLIFRAPLPYHFCKNMKSLKFRKP